MTSISSSTNTISSLTAKTGIGGLVSGMDIDELVESLSATSRQKIIKQQQNIQKFEWKQSAYRSVSTIMKDFQSKYLDVLSKTNLRSESFYKTVIANSSSDAVSVSPTSSATAGIMTISSIQQLATNQKTQSGASVSKPLAGKMTSVVPGVMDAVDIDALATNLSGKSILLTLDGKSKTITFDSTFEVNLKADPTTTNLQASIQSLVNTAFGITKPEDQAIILGVSGDILTFSAPGSKLSVNALGGDTATLTSLGLTDGQSNKMSLLTSMETASLNEPLVGTGDLEFSINSVAFTVSKGDSISSVIEKINASTAGVTMAYSSITDKFTMTANEGGAGNIISVSDTNGNLMAAFGLTSDSGSLVTAGVNAILTVNDQQIIRSSNDIEVDGLKLTLSRTTDIPLTITSKVDSSTLMDPIKNFITDYNTMIESMNKSIKEAVYKDYQPLTEAQKADMSETEIKSWEEKSKSGILKGDSIIRGITSKFQAAISGLSIDGTSLYSLGITSAGYNENGKLQIDETKLKTSLDTNSTGVRDLFTSETGLGNALNNIIMDAIKTSGVKGSRGTLTEAAGVASTTSDLQNLLTDSITQTNKTIVTLQARLKTEETQLWRKFTAMEQALSQLNGQSSYISQFSAG
jgi:flagellar hook-associated protein 2